MPSLDMWESFRTVVDPLPTASRTSIERLVSRVFALCEAVIIVNAPSLLKMLKPAIPLMIPVSNERLFVSTDLSALLRAVQPSEVPRPYNSNATASASNNPQTEQLYSILNSRAQEVLGRPLALNLSASLPPPVGEQATAKQPPTAPNPQPASPTDTTSAWEAEGGDDDDDFDDID